MDKWATKQTALSLGLRTAPAEILDAATVASGAMPAFGTPLVVKPVDQGSSVGTFIVRAAADFAPALRSCTAQFGRALVEQFIDGREITVGILDKTPLPPIWIKPNAGFYDYHAKYLANDTEYRFDTGLPEAAAAALQADSLRLFEALGCRHLARIDWIVDSSQRGWLLEANTLPGFTSHSLVPKAAERAGVPFDELCERLAFAGLEELR